MGLNIDAKESASDWRDQLAAEVSGFAGFLGGSTGAQIQVWG